MLDIKYIRKHPEEVKDNLKKRGIDIELLYQLLNVDIEYRKLTNKIERLRQIKNRLTQLISGNIDY